MRDGRAQLLGAMIGVLLLAGPVGVTAAMPDAWSAPPDSAVLRVFNRPIYTYRAPLGAATPAERAEVAAKRIERTLQRGRPGTVETRPVGAGVLVVLEGRPVISVMPADVDSLMGETVQSTADSVAARLRVAMAAAEEQRRPGRVLRAVLASLAALVVFVLLVRFLRRVHRFLLRLIARRAQAVQQELRVGSFEIFDVQRFLLLSGRIAAGLLWLVGFVLADLVLTFVLTRFPYTAPWGHALGKWFASTASGVALAVLRALPGILTVVVIFVVARIVTRTIGDFFGAVQQGRVHARWLHPDTALPTQRIVVGLLWIFAVMVAYPFVPGSGSGVFKGVSLFLGLVFSLGSSATVNQAMSGFVLMYSRSFRVGDFVRIGDTEGTITELGMLSTKIRTNKRELVTIPNSVVVGTGTKNYSRLAQEGQPLLVSTTVTIGYDAPWRLVHAMLDDAASRTSGLLREPAPFVLQTALSDFYVEYTLVVPIEKPHERIRVLAELHTHIQDCFNENGVQIMSPHFEGQPEKPVLSPPPGWNPSRAARAGGEPPARPAPTPRDAAS